MTKMSSASSLEMGGKDADDAGKVGFASSSLNLIKTIMGTGMLVLPFAFQTVSLIPALLLLIFAAIVSGFGLYLLTMASLRVSGGRKADFATLAKATYPRLTPLFDLAILLKCLGVAIGYLVVIGQVTPKLMMTAFTTVPSLLMSPVFWITISAALICPVVFIPRMDSLKYTSLLGMLSIAYIVGLSGFLYFSSPSTMIAPIAWWSPPSAIVMVKNFGVFVFAFTCHQNMLPIQNEARRNDQGSMTGVITLCIGLATTLYILFGSFSLAVFGHLKPLPDNIILSYPASGIAFVLARSLYAFLVLFSIPLQTFPARNSTAKIIQFYSPAFAQRHAKLIYHVSTGLIFGFSWIMACTGLDLSLLLRLVGSTAGPILCYVLPSLFWFSLESKAPWGPLKMASMGLLAFGLAALCISTAALFL